MCSRSSDSVPTAPHPRRASSGLVGLHRRCAPVRESVREAGPDHRSGRQFGIIEHSIVEDPSQQGLIDRDTGESVKKPPTRSHWPVMCGRVAKRAKPAERRIRPQCPGKRHEVSAWWRRPGWNGRSCSYRHATTSREWNVGRNSRLRIETQPASGGRSAKGCRTSPWTSPDSAMRHWSAFGARWLTRAAACSSSAVCNAPELTIATVEANSI
ncbi:hypothetical protein SAMN04489751_2426 [Brevibacterium sandarakinum]|uniref:Uncharacterized protein n=1 Tax=Brevibacterium sandarakinum TaxID=629680 RepID=A0A1H1TNW2_BRESA|nr:hypothetical protein SAMN04489751_2426 [Brevibacterium sandarakinum]